jgi:hypothetical protein
LGKGHLGEEASPGNDHNGESLYENYESLEVLHIRSDLSQYVPIRELTRTIGLTNTPQTVSADALTHNLTCRGYHQDMGTSFHPEMNGSHEMLWSQYWTYLNSWTRTKSFLALVAWHPTHVAGVPDLTDLPVGVYLAQNQSPAYGLYPWLLYITVMAFSSLALL